MTSTTDKHILFVDSSAWISAVVTTDVNYQKAASIFSSFHRKTVLYISILIISEVVTKIRKILGQKKAYSFYSQLLKLEKEKSLIILPVEKDIIDKAINLLNRYPTPNTFSLTDAVNIILMQKYNISVLFSFDRDFKKLKIHHLSILP